MNQQQGMAHLLRQRQAQLAEYGPQQGQYLPPFNEPHDISSAYQTTMPNPDHTFDPPTFKDAMMVGGVGMGLGAGGSTFVDPRGVNPGRTLGTGAAVGMLPGAILGLGSHFIQQGNEHAANNEYSGAGPSNRHDMRNIMEEIAAMKMGGT